MEYSLKIIEGSEKGLIFSLNAGELSVGRDPGCDIVLSDSKVSRRHAVFRRDGPAYYVEDLESANGTLVNGEEVDIHKLAEGNVVIIGKTSFHFVASSSNGQDGMPAQTDNQAKTITMDTDSLLSRWPADETEEALYRAKADLETLYRVGQMAGGLLETPGLILKILDMLFVEMDYIDRASIHMMKGTGLKCVAFRVGSERKSPADAPLSRTIARTVALSKRAVLTYNAMVDKRFQHGESVQTERIRAAICAPLICKGEINGMIYVDILNGENQFSSDDLRLVAGIGMQMGAQLENARLYERLAQEKNALTEAHEQLKSTQQELVQSEKLAAIGRLSSGIVHDIKTPLSVVLGYTGLLKNHMEKIDGSQTVKVDNCIGEIEKAIEHCNGMIQDLLQFARPSPPEKSTLSLNKLLEDTLQFLSVEFNKAGVNLQVDTGDNLPPVMADENQIKQVLMNIIMNALQAMDKTKKTLSIQTEKRELGGAGTRACVVIQDNGKGMSDSERARIFEPFFTTKQSGDGGGGTGLGLSVSYGLIHSHGGHIEVDSEPGQGTTFTLMLPVGVS